MSADTIGAGSFDVTLGFSRAEAQAQAFFNKQRSMKADFTAFAPLGRISKDANQVERSLEAANARVIAFGASAGVFTLISVGLKTMLKDTINVEKALLDINTILGASSSGLKEFSGALFEIAKNTGQSFDTAAEAAKEFSRQGLSLEDTLKRTNAALVLTRISGLDGAKSVTALTTAINSFNKEALTQEDVVNRLANVDAKFAVSSEDLANALSVGGSAAQAAGVSLNEFLAVVTSVKQKTGQSGNQIANALKGIFVRTGRSDTLDELEKVGVAVRDLAGNTLPGVKILQNLANVQDNLSDSQKAYIDDLTAGTYRVNQLKAALSDVSKATGTYAGALKAAGSASNAAFDRSEKLNASLASQANAAKVNITKIFSDIGGDLFGPVLKELFSGIEKVAQSGDVGSKLGQGIAKGLGDFLAGPGLIFLGGIFAKVFSKFIYNAGQAFASINKIGDTLANIAPILDKIVSKESASLSREQSKLKVIEAQNTALQKQASIIPKGNSAFIPPVGGGRGTVNNSSYGAGRVGSPNGPFPSPRENFSLSSLRSQIAEKDRKIKAFFEDTSPRNTQQSLAISSLNKTVSTRYAAQSARDRINESQRPESNFNKAQRLVRERVNPKTINPDIFEASQSGYNRVENNRINKLLDGIDRNNAFRTSNRDTGRIKRRQITAKDAESLLDERIAENGPIDRRFLGGVRSSLSGAKDSLLQTRNVRGTGAALGLSLAGSITGEAIGGSRGEAISGVSNAVGSGAAIAAISPNAIGLVVGGVVASFKLLEVAIDSSADSVSSLNKKDQKKIDKNDSDLSLANDASSAFARLKSVASRSLSDSSEVNRAKGDVFQTAPQGLLDLLPNKKLLDNTIEDLTQALDDFKTETDKSTKKLKAFQQIKSLLGDDFDFLGSGPGALSIEKGGGTKFIDNLKSSGIGSDLSNDQLRAAQNSLSPNNISAVTGTLSQLGLPKEITEAVQREIGDGVRSLVGDLSLFLQQKIDQNNTDITPNKTLPKGFGDGNSFKFANNPFKIASDKTQKAFRSDSSAREINFAQRSADTDRSLSIRSALNDANSSFNDPSTNISNQFDIERQKLTSQSSEELDKLNDSLRKFTLSLNPNVQSFSNVSGNRESLQKLIGSGSVSDNPSEQLKQIVSILEESQNRTEETNKIADEAKNLLNSVETSSKSIEVNSKSSFQKLRDLEAIQKAVAFSNKLQNNFGGTGALSSKQDLSEISGGRRARFQNILEANNPRFQQNKAFELQYSADPDSIRKRNQQTALNRSNEIGRGIISSAQNGDSPSKLEIAALADGDRKNSLTKAFNTQRDQLKGAYAADSNNRINENASSIVSDLQGSLGGQYNGDFRPESIFKKAGESAQSGNLNDVEKQLQNLLDRSSPDKKSVISDALSRVQGLNSQKQGIEVASGLRADTALGGSDAATNKTLIDLFARYFTVGGGAIQVQQNTPNTKEETKNTFAEILKEIKNGKFPSVQDKADALGAAAADTVRSSQEFSSKVEVLIRNQDSDGSGYLSQEEAKALEESLKFYVAEFIKTKGNPAPRTPATK